MPNFEAIGDAVTGGVIGKAVEPPTGDGGYTHETHCLNCGAELTGPYCSLCGQHAHVHRTLTAFFHDLLHGVLHFEGKIWRTLPLLVWRPGELTRRYIDGQRARFVSPIALFLFFVFITFATMTLAGSALGPTAAADARQEMARESARNEQKIAVLESAREVAVKAGRSTSKIDSKIADLRTETAAISALNAQKVVSPVVVDTTDMPAWLGSALAKAKDNPELLLYKVKTNAYKFSWALIPISVPFVWSLFPFSRRFRMYDHTVFVTYSLSFMMLLVVTSTILGFVSQTVAALAFLVPPFHMYRQLRGTYAIGRFGAAWRTIALTIFAFIAISLFVSLLLGIGAFD